MEDFKLKDLNLSSEESKLKEIKRRLYMVENKKG